MEVEWYWSGYVRGRLLNALDPTRSRPAESTEISELSSLSPNCEVTNLNEDLRERRWKPRRGFWPDSGRGAPPGCGQRSVGESGETLGHGR